MNSFRKWMILAHRYLGIPLSVIFVVWFGSGIAMIWARGMPSLTPELRLERLPSLDLTEVELSPFEAAERAGLRSDPGQAVLLNVMTRPAYRFTGRTGATVFADNGELLGELDATGALRVANQFLEVGGGNLRHEGVLSTPDQWTLGVRDDLPLHKVVANDADRTELYVSPRNAEVTVLTTRGTRALAWIAAIPHWFYFESLRANGPLWSQVVIWTALVGTVFAVLGVVVGLLQLSRKRGSLIPYRGGMRWHHITGLIFGVFTITWAFSGMLSMDPWGWATGSGLSTGAARRALTGGPLEMSLFPEMEAGAWHTVLAGRDAKEISFVRIQGDPYYDVLLADGEQLLVQADPLAVRAAPFTTESIITRVRESSSDVPIVASELLTDYDGYYYSPSNARPLPVLRVKFADPAETWFYIDPARSRILGSFHSRQRIDRWIYNGFHSLDFNFWYGNRTVWTVGIVLLSLGGLVSSGLGMFLGFRRLYRGVRRVV